MTVKPFWSQTLLLRPLLATLTLCAGMSSMAQSAPPTPGPHPNDFPTYERVRYVFACIDKNGSDPALMYQCSCAVDAMAERFTIDEFVEYQTALNSASIAGERGGAVRDNPDIRMYAKRYREAEAAAYKACGVAKH